MRSRNIKPGFFKNEELAECSPFSRLLFVGLWCMADREGRLEKRPLRIKAEIFPYDSLDINGELTVLERKGFVKTYVVEGKEYLQVVNFKIHQSPHHTEAKSKLPDISEGCDLTVNSPLDNGKNPPDSLIHGFSDSLIHKPTTTTHAQEQLTSAVTENHDRLKTLFPNINLPVATEKLLYHYRASPTLLDPYLTALNWFQKEFPQTGATNGNRHQGSTSQAGRKAGLIEANRAGTDFLS